MLKKLLLLTILGTLVTSCANMNQTQRNTATGAVIGGAAGAIIGDSTGATLGGAALGGLIGSQAE